LNLDMELQRFHSDVMQSLSAFQRIVTTVHKKTGVKIICEEAVKILSDELGLDHCSIMLLDERGDYVVNQAGMSAGEISKGESFLDRAFKVGEGVAGMVAKTNTPILIPDADKDGRFLKLESAVDIGSLLCLPVCTGDRVIGVLNLSHKRRNFFSRHHEKVFSILSATIGHLITFVRLQKDLESLNRDLQLTVMERTREIEESNEYLRNIFDNASDIIFTIDNEGRFTFLNKRVEDLGYTKDELVGQSFDCLLISEEGIRAFVNVLKQGDKKTVEIDLKGKDDRVWQTLCSFTPLKSSSEGITGLLGIAKDITGRKMLERKLLQTEKLASLGTFVSGIAHELNNRLQPVLVYSEILLDASIGENQLKLINTINRSAMGAKHIVESLLRFSRQEKPHKSLVNLNEVLNSVVHILSYRMTSSSISLKVELDKALPMTFADEKQIEQVFLNIINNACDAFEEKGGEGNEIMIRSHFTDLDIFFEIRNNGPEIPKDKLGKIFDPFYTSKEVGKGTGLGLSLCYGIVQEHGGDISVSSEEGRTTFSIRIPVTATKEYTSQTPSVPKETDKAGGGKGGAKKDKKRVLIVDDEEDQVEVMQYILRERYTTVGVNSGKEAIERLKSEVYDLIVCDVKMPGIDGAGVYDWVRENKPSMASRMLFSTGDTLGPRAEKIISRIGDHYIIKPYNADEFLRKVENILTQDEHLHNA